MILIYLLRLVVHKELPPYSGITKFEPEKLND